MSDRITRPSRSLPGAPVAARRSTPSRRIVAFAAALAVAAGVVLSTSGAISTSVVEARDAARSASVTRLETAHVASAALLRTSAADTRRTVAAAAASAEIVRARGVLASSAGRAAEAGRSALSTSIDAVVAAAGSASAFRITAGLVHLKESEKAVTDSVAAWEAAEQQRLAAEAAAAAAARAAAEYQSAQASVSHSSTTRSAASPAPAAVAPSAPYYAPGVTSTAPDNSGCGPCPGATLVLTPSGYWGCP